MVKQSHTYRNIIQSHFKFTFAHTLNYVGANETDLDKHYKCKKIFNILHKKFAMYWGNILYFTVL